MDFSLTPKTEQLRKRVSDFMDQYVFPIEKEVQRAMGESGNTEPQSLKDVRKKAKAEGLWNLFLPDEKFGAGLKNYEYAPLCELMGRSSIGARAFNCMAPDTGNMEILAEFGTPDQKKQWLQKCLDGEIRTCFSMTEPDTPGSDPTQLKTRAVRDGDNYVINGHKWFTSNAIGSAFAIAMVVTDPDAEPHRRASQIIVPTDTPGIQPDSPGARDGPHRRRRPLRDHLQGLPRAGDQPARRGRRRLRDLAGAPRPGTHPSLHAHDRNRRARARADVQTREHALHARQLSRRQVEYPGMDRQLAHRDRLVPPDGACTRRGRWTPRASATRATRSR